MISNSEQNGSFPVLILSNNAQAVCISSCNYTFSVENTPRIDSVSPFSISFSNTITITGANFGTISANIIVNIGTQNCLVLNSTQTEINCQLDGLELDKQNINLNIKGYLIMKLKKANFLKNSNYFHKGIGNALNPSYLNLVGKPSIQTITPGSGSTFGGTILTLTGNGFSKTTQVLIDTVKCSLISIKVNELKCVTGSHSASTSSFSIT